MSLSKPVDKSSTNDSLDAYNPLAIARYVPVSADITRTMRRMIAILSSVGGLDRVFMLINVSIKNVLLITLADVYICSMAFRYLRSCLPGASTCPGTFHRLWVTKSRCLGYGASLWLPR